MVIKTAYSLAFYCQQCGKIHVHDIPYFLGTRRMVLRCDSCAHEQVVLLCRDMHRLELQIACAACGTMNVVHYSLRKLRRTQLERVYCSKDRFELGYIGKHRCIEELLAFNQARFALLYPGQSKDLAEKQRILLQAMNRVHEIAEQGTLLCSCGSHDMMVELRGNAIILTCEQCGSYCVLHAGKPEDLARLQGQAEMEFILPSLRKKH